MDFVRERREWEERLRRRAAMEGHEAEDVEMGGGGEEGGLVPLTEEEEVEALAEYLVGREDDEEGMRRTEAEELSGMNMQEEAESFPRPDPAERRHSGGSYGSDEEDYDQLFMEVISASQEQEGSERWVGQQCLAESSAGFGQDYGLPSSQMDLS
jgi:hypothetical protein